MTDLLHIWRGASRSKGRGEMRLSKRSANHLCHLLAFAGVSSLLSVTAPPQGAHAVISLRCPDSDCLLVNGNLAVYLKYSAGRLRAADRSTWELRYMGHIADRADPRP